MSASLSDVIADLFRSGHGCVWLKLHEIFQSVALAPRRIMSAEAPKIVDPDAKAAPKPDTKELAKPAKASKPRIDCNSENNISEVNNQ